MPPNQDQEHAADPLHPPSQPVIASEQQVPQQLPNSLNAGGMKVIQPTGNVIAPEGPATPQVVVSSQTSDALTASTPAVASSPVPQNIYPQPQTTGLSRSEIEAAAGKENKKNLVKKMLIFAPLSILLIAAVGVAIVYSGFFSKFKTITYDNGKSVKVQLQFYSHYSVKNAPGATDGVQELVSNTAAPGLYPLTLLITKGNQQGYQEYQNCTGPGAPGIALSAANKQTGNTVNLCSIRQQGATSPTLYLGVMQSGSNYYTLLFAQDVNFQQLLSSPQAAKTGLQKIDLSAYDNDITTIVSSIKPAQ